MAQPIAFYGLRKPIKDLSRNTLRKCIREVAKNHKFNISNISYIITNDEFLLELNKKHLKHNTLTDIITFDLSTNPTNIDAEIYISAERVFENAIIFQATQEEEMLRVIFHGLLHLCGYKDKTKSEQKLMRQLESQCLNLYREKQ